MASENDRRSLSDAFEKSQTIVIEAPNRGITVERRQDDRKRSSPSPPNRGRSSLFLYLGLCCRLGMFGVNTLGLGDRLERCWYGLQLLGDVLGRDGLDFCKRCLRALTIATLIGEAGEVSDAPSNFCLDVHHALLVVTSICKRKPREVSSTGLSYVDPDGVRRRVLDPRPNSCRSGP